MAGEKIQTNNGVLNVPNHPVIPFIEGDGIGPDIWAAASRVIDAAVEKAYKGEKKIDWLEVYAGQKAFDKTGEWLPQDTLDKIDEYLIAIKGPLTTPIGGGFRSLNVTLRQELDLFACLRPVRHYSGVPSPVKHPEHCDMQILEKTLKIFTRESNLTKVRLKLKKLSISYKMKWALKISVSLSLLQLLLSRFLKKELSVWYVLRLIMQSSTTNHLSL